MAGQDGHDGQDGQHAQGAQDVQDGCYASSRRAILIVTVIFKISSDDIKSEPRPQKTPYKND